MKSCLKNNLTKALIAVFALSAAYFSEPLTGFQALPFETQEAALFGVGSDEFTPYVEKTHEDKVRSWVKWTLFAAGALLILVLGYVFDIAAYTFRITGKKVVNANKVNAWLMLVFLVVGMVFAIWEFVAHGKYTKVYNSSSEHGADMDSMFMVTFTLTAVVFILTQIVLFVYAFIYQEKEGRKATYYPHNNRLEVFWTIIPSIVLTFLVLRGYAVWKNVMYDTDKIENVQEIEVFAYQFGWTARYPGPDGKFGAHSFNYISGTNQLGLAVESQVEELKEELRRDTAEYAAKLANIDGYVAELKEAIVAHKRLANFKGVKDTEKEIAKVKSGDYEKELRLMLRRRTKQLERMALVESNEEEYDEVFDGSVHDDLVVKEIVVLKGQHVKLKFRSRDVIHSAFLPDFRVQMNCVPGMDTEFAFVPTKSTEEIRKEKGDDTYDYYLYCNKICGQAHFNMKIKFTVVETETEYKTWLAEQKPAFPVELPVKKNTEEEETSEVEVAGNTISTDRNQQVI